MVLFQFFSLPYRCIILTIIFVLYLLNNNNRSTAPFTSPSNSPLCDDLSVSVFNDDFCDCRDDAAVDSR